MSWVRTISEEQATGELADTYAAIRETWQWKAISGLWQAVSLHPSLVRLHSDLSRVTKDEGLGLTTARREMIAVAVSSQNSCSY